MAMAENDRGDTASSKEGEAWGTFEELLLACAVGRHGTNSWDSIAMEVQKRTTPKNGNSQINNNILNAFTPHDCRQRYHALKRRFNVTSGEERNERPDGDGDASQSNNENEVGGERELREKLPFIVDELRKLRVEELRRDLERHDVSIVSLQLKVKRLEEDRERNSLKAEVASGGADLRTRTDRSDVGDERRRRQPDRSSAEVADKSMSSERSDEPEDRSYNESNSTSQKGAPSQGKETNRRREPGENRNNEPDPVRPVAESEPDKDSSSSRRGGDCCGVEEEEEKVGRASQPVPLGDSGELRESLSESKREAAGEVKQSSDVQSSASLSRRKRRGWRRSDGVGAGSSGDEVEAEELSPANRRMDVKSQPLIKILGILRSHEHGLVFQRRLPSQETEEYRNLVRQHMDLEIVQSKLERALYCDSPSKLYRDILLIFTNAAVFFHKNSPEHLAAHELRKSVTKEIVAQRLPQKPKTSQLVKPATDLESQIHDPVVKKPRSSTNIVVCRRRTNPNAIKPSSLSSDPNTTKSKEEEIENADHHKDEPKKLKKERSNLLVGRSLATKTATSTNNSGGSGNKKSKGMAQGESNYSNNVSASNKGKKDESSDEEEQPINKRRRLLQPSLKKQGVVNFLKRMKQNSPSKEAMSGANEAEEEQEDRATKKTDTSKKKLVVGKKKEGGDNNGGGGGGVSGKDDGAAKRISGRRSTRGGEETERSENMRRGGGRPPTRKAAMGNSGRGGGTPDSGRLKRQRDGDKEVAASGRGTTTTAKKKARR